MLFFPLHRLVLLSYVFSSWSGRSSSHYSRLLHQETPPRAENIFSKNSSKKLGPDMAPSALGYVPTCNHCMTTHPPKPMGRKEQPGSCKELERGRAGLQKEEGKKFSWKKEEMLVMQKALFSLTISKALTTALRKIKKSCKE